MSDLIDRQAAIDALCAVCGNDCDKSEFVYNAPQDEQVILCPEHYCLCMLPSVQPDNQTNLCDSCDYSYPECPSKNDDVIFGNGIGNDNICACNKYKPSTQPVRKNGKWIRTRTLMHEGELYCDQCDQEHPEQKKIWNFCPNCGCHMEEGDSDEKD